MTTFSYENQGANTYLVYKVGEGDDIDTMSLGMITNNHILGLAPASFMQMNSDKFIKYNVSAKIPVKQFFSGPVNKRRLLGVFNGIASAMLSAEDYMIDPSTILIDTNYMFADVSTCETVLICLPLNSVGENVDFGAFFKNIIFGTQFDQTEDCGYVAKIINYLNSTPVFSFVQFKQVLDDLKNTNRPQAQAQNRPGQTTAGQPMTTQNQTPQKKSVLPDNSNSGMQTPTVTQPPKVQPVQPQKAAQPSTVASPVGNKSGVVPQKIPGQSGMKIPNANGGMNIPGGGKMPEKKPEKDENTQQQTEGESISLFYLLQHYNSENAAAYKAQKEAKKSGGASHKEKPKKENKHKNTAVPSGVSGGMAIPGQTPDIKPVEQKTQTAVRTMNVPENGMQTPVKPTPVSPISAQPVQNGGWKGVTPIPQPTQAEDNFSQIQNIRVVGSNFGETTFLDNGTAGQTTMLDVTANVQARQINPQLVRVRNNEIIPVNKPNFRIGKEKSFVDYFVGDNPAISRSHANIITRDGKYYVLDTNSTNHTYVDGRMIPSGTEVEIISGTHLRFANEDFEFRL